MRVRSRLNEMVVVYVTLPAVLRLGKYRKLFTQFTGIADNSKHAQPPVRRYLY